jgi:hypothetical protein
MSTSQPTEQEKEIGYWPYILYAIGTCTVLVFVFGYAVKSWAVISTELLIGFAALSVGFLIGFLFGLPRAGMQNISGESSSESDTGKAKDSINKVTYRPSTNLEQISDWLTKILIGVGLVELGQVKFLLAELGRVIGKLTPDFPGNEVLPQIVLVAFSMIGFFIGYIWTRIEYTKLQVGTDKSIWAKLQSVSDVTELIAKGELVSPNVDNNSINDADSGERNKSDTVDTNKTDKQVDTPKEVDTPSVSEEEIDTKDLEKNISSDELVNNQPVSSYRILRTESHDSNAKYPLEFYEIVNWPNLIREKIRSFNNAVVNAGNLVAALFNGFPNESTTRVLIARVENIIGETVVFSATVRQRFESKEGEVWFLLNPIFGSNRIKRVPIVNGEAKIIFSTTSMFTIAAIMDKGMTTLVFDLRNTENLPNKFRNLST